MKAKFTKRCVAYLIDIMIVTMISSLIMVFLPINNSKNISDELIEIMTTYEKEKISETEYLEKYEELNYELSKETVTISLVSIGIYIIYFVVIPVYNKKQTFGKRVMKIKIKNIEEKNVTGNDLMFRSLIVYGILFNIVSIILILFLNQDIFIIANKYLSYLYDIMLVIILLLSIIRKDGRGLHDFVGKTIVVEEE